MKKFSLLVFLVAFNVHAADLKKEIERTAQSPTILKVLGAIPLGQKICETEAVESCHNPKQDCLSSCATVNGEDCSYHCFSDSDSTECSTSYEEVCKWRQTTSANLELNLKIDTRAVLTGNQKEEFEVKGDYNNKTRLIDLRIKVKSKAYKYNFPAKLSVQPDVLTAIDFNLK